MCLSSIGKGGNQRRLVVSFLVAEGAGTREIHHHLSAVYGEHFVPDKCAWVAEVSPQRIHITARRFAPGSGPSSYCYWCDCANWWSNPETSFCMIMPVPMLPVWWVMSFRDLAGKHFNILRTAQIFPLATSKFWRPQERHSWTSISFWRGSARVGGVVDPSATYLFLPDCGIDRLVSQWDKICINS